MSEPLCGRSVVHGEFWLRVSERRWLEVLVYWMFLTHPLHQDSGVKSS